MKAKKKEKNPGKFFRLIWSIGCWSVVCLAYLPWVDHKTTYGTGKVLAKTNDEGKIELNLISRPL